MDSVSLNDMPYEVLYNIYSKVCQCNSPLLNYRIRFVNRSFRDIVNNYEGDDWKQYISFDKQDYKYPFYLCGPGLLGNVLNKMLGRNIFEPFNTVVLEHKLDNEIIKIFPSEEIDIYMITKYSNYLIDCNKIESSNYWNCQSFNYEKAKKYFLRNDLILRYNK